LQSTAQKGDWYQVRLPHPPDVIGWIRSDLVELRPVVASPQAVAQATPEVQEAESASEEMLTKLDVDVVEALQPVAKIEVTKKPAALKEEYLLASTGQTAKESSNRVLYLSIILACTLFVALISIGTSIFVPKTPAPRAPQAQPSGNKQPSPA